MFQAKDAMFIYCVSPVHMGAGTSIGVIDNPIQRERHTGHPVMAGSGLKGALRHEAVSGWQEKQEALDVFGPDTAQSSDYAGALSLGDGQIVAFPVRSLKHGYAYASSPIALGRLRRILAVAGMMPGGWEAIDEALGWKADECAVIDQSLLGDGHLVLEAFRFRSRELPALTEVAAWLAEHALPAGDSFGFFREKLAKHLVLLSEDRFGYFVKNAVVVEPHVRIDDDTGTADDGGLFYTENLPPESLLVSLVMASRRRRKDNGQSDAQDVLALVRERFGGQVLQVGGDATSGRGQVTLNFAGRQN